LAAFLNIASSAAALLAAGFWLWSAATRFPELRPDADKLIDALQSRSQALRRQSRRNAAAALAAGAAALFQAIGLISAWPL
jgi:hypothetical protein